MGYKVIDIEQGSDQWLALRKNCIGASDAPTVMGVNPWRTPFRLWQEKLGLIEPEPYNDNMRRGHLLEPIARNLINEHLGMDFKPIVLQSLEMPWMIASYDGIASNGTLLEIKCPKNGVHECIPDYYRPQLCHQMVVAGVTKCLYMSYHEGLYKVIGTELDQQMVDTMLRQEEEFYRCLMEFEAPALCDRDYINRESEWEWTENTAVMKEIKGKRKYLDELERSTKEKLIQLSGNVNSMGNGIRLSKVLKRGAIDYKSIPAIQQMDVEPFRGKPIEYWRVS